MEPIGLGIGVAGLAGLFSACIDCFELVQRGRYHGRDYLLLETKFANQSLRLKTWGRACGFLDNNSDDNTLGDEEIRDSIEMTLAHLFVLLKDGHQLSTRYGLKRDQPPQTMLSIGAMSISARMSNRFPMKTRLSLKLQELKESVYKTQQNVKIVEKVRWAIEDRYKFAELIQHLKDLIDDLEGLTNRLDLPALIQCEVESISNTLVLENMEEARLGKIDLVSDAASVRLWELRDRHLEIGHQERSETMPHSRRMSMNSSEVDWDDMGHDISILPEIATQSCYQILYKVSCTHEAVSMFFDVPSYSSWNNNDNQWVVLDHDRPTCESKALHLHGRRPVLDLEAYLNQNSQLSFVVFKTYKCSHNETQVEDEGAMVSAQSIYLWSSELCTALTEMLAKASEHAQLAGFQPRTELLAPYHWFHHSNRLKGVVEDDISTPAPMHQNVKTFLDIISETMADEYSAVDALVSEQSITWAYLPYIFVPGDIVLQTCSKGEDYCQAHEVVSLQIEDDIGEDSPCLVLHVRSCVFDGKFQNKESVWRLPRSQFTADDSAPFPISSMPVRPLEYDKENMRKELVHRGKTFWKCRYKRLIRYTGPVADPGNHTRERRFMIDTLTYHRLHSEVPLENSTRRSDGSDAGAETSWDMPNERFLLLLPPTIYGYDMYQHEWTELLVSKIADVVWNRYAFEQVALPWEGRDMLANMARIGIEDDAKPYRNHPEQNEQILLLHGGPGTGKSFAAEAIAEATKRPLYRISCTTIISAPREAEHSLKAIADLCNTWNCVAVMEDVHVCFKDRASSDRDRDTIVLILNRSLEFFHNTLILTTQSVCRIGQPVWYRCCLRVDFQELTDEGRTTIWSNIIGGRGMSSPPSYFKIEKYELRELAYEQLNAWEITYVVKSAVQLARVDSKHVDMHYLRTAIKNIVQFSNYLNMVN